MNTNKAMQQPHTTKSGTRRITLTIPRESLATARQIARARKVGLIKVISEAVEEGLRAKVSAERGAHVLESYRRAFSCFNDEERMLLDGIVLDERVDR
jgi:hypothetical protein